VRVAHFTDTYLPRRDGVITSIRTLVDAQTAAGHGAITVVPRHPDQPADQALLQLPAVPLGVAGLRVSPGPLRGAACRGTIAELEALSLDVIHVHTPGPVGLLGVVAARRLGLPLVQTYHTDLHAYVEAYRFPVPALRAGVRLYARRLDLPRPSVGRGRADRGWLPSRRPGRRGDALDACNALLLRDCDAVVVPTRAVLSRISLPVAVDRIFVVPSGVGPRIAPPAAVAAFRHRHGLVDGDRVLLFVGRINREKGIDLLVESFAAVVARRPQARLLLVGAMYEPRWFAGLLREIGPAAASRVVCAGEQPADVVAAAYGAADVFAFPSRTDTQALVLQEAALSGVPAVLADPALHEHGALAGAAVCAEPSPEAFAQALVSLLDDPGEARRLGAVAAVRAAEHTPARYGAAMLEVYARAAAERQAPRVARGAAAMPAGRGGVPVV
jgi:glycosyltransferase involved in cell wall biosynthesis